jgi:methionine-R-sulfoxide reductase
MQFNSLTAQEKYVIEAKGTEEPFSGKYYQHFAPGVYNCKKCAFPLYTSAHKFSSNCGWPSFDSCIPEAVTEQLDQDGVRREIICSQCSGHLGHVFYGEDATATNARHCVNSISLIFTPRNE